MTDIMACVGPTIVSVTGGTETEIGGATAWTVPSGVKSIKGIRGKVACGTVHDAVLTAVPTVRIYAKGLTIEPCQILLEIPGSSPVTHGSGESMWESKFYPLNIPVKSGDVIHFYGKCYVTMTTAPWMGIDILYSTEAAQSPQYFYDAWAAVYATTVTAGAQHKNPTTLTINGKRITRAFGVVWQTTSTAAVGCIGKFEITSTGFKAPYSIEWMNEGGSGILSVGDLAVHVSQAGSEQHPLSIDINDPCLLTENFTNGPTNIVGAYVCAVQFIK